MAVTYDQSSPIDPSTLNSPPDANQRHANRNHEPNRAIVLPDANLPGFQGVRRDYQFNRGKYQSHGMLASISEEQERMQRFKKVLKNQKIQINGKTESRTRSHLKCKTIGLNAESSKDRKMTEGKSAKGNEEESIIDASLNRFCEKRFSLKPTTDSTTRRTIRHFDCFQASNHGLESLKSKKAIDEAMLRHAGILRDDPTANYARLKPRIQVQWESPSHTDARIVAKACLPSRRPGHHQQANAGGHR